MSYNPYYPHRERVSVIKVILSLLLAFIAVYLVISCSTPKYGCRSTSGANYKAGYHPKK